MNHLFKNPHVTALITVFFWSTTFIATKLLLIDFSPTAILFLRFIIGLVVLSVLSKFSRIHYHFRQHLYLMAAGISGVCFYFFLENIALSYTSTSNVAVAFYFTDVSVKFMMGNAMYEYVHTVYDRRYDNGGFNTLAVVYNYKRMKYEVLVVSDEKVGDKEIHIL